MAVEDRAKELNSLAEKIRGSFTRFNSQLKSISDKRKRISRNVAERKERRAKLKASASSFGRSVGSITSNVLKTPGDIFGKVISFASLFLLGALVNMIPQREQQVDKDLEKTKEKSTKVGNFFIGMVDAVKGFFGSFDKTKTTADNTLAGVNDSFEEANKEFGALKRDSKIKKNYEKVSEEFIDTKSALVRDKDLGSGEVVPFDRKMIINRIEDTFGRTDLTFEDKVMDGKEVVVISQKILVD